MNNKVLTILSLALVVMIYIIFSGGSSSDAKSNPDTVSGNNVEIRNGIQYITVHAGGGYSPRTSNAQAGIPTKLIMKTSGSYDCSSSLIIRSITVSYTHLR